MTPIIIYSIVAIIVLVVLYQIFKFYNRRKIIYRQEKKVIKLVHDATLYKKFPNKNIPTSKFSNEYSYSFWMHVDNYKYRFRNKKIIFNKGSKNSSEFNPEVSLDPVDNKLIVKIQIQSEDVDAFANVSDSNEKFQNTGSNSQPQSQPLALDQNQNESDIPTVYSNISGNMVPSSGNGDDNTDVVEHFYQNLGENNLNSDVNSGLSETNMVVGSENDVPDLVSQLKGLVDGTSDLLMESFQNNTDDDNVPDANNDVPNDVPNDDDIIIPECTATEEDLIEIYYNIFLYLCDTMKDVRKPANVRKFIDDIDRLVFRPIESAIINKKKSQLEAAQREIMTYVQDNLNRQPSEEEEKLLEYVYQHEVIKASCDLNSFDKDKIVKSIDEKLKQSDCPIKLQEGPSSIYNLIKNSVISMFLNACDYVRENNPQIADRLLSGKDQCVLKDVPLQKWVHIVVSVYNNTCDIYIDGKLGSSCVLKGFPQLNQGDLHIAPDGGFGGRIANVIAISMALNQDEVYNIYQKGPKLTKSLWDTVKGKF